MERVVQPKIVASWNFMPSLTQRDKIEQAVFVEVPRTPTSNGAAG